jgi:hypothetical protein
MYELAAKLKIPVFTFEVPTLSTVLGLSDRLNKFEKLRKSQLIKQDPWLWKTRSSDVYAQVVSEGDQIAKKYGYSHQGFIEILKKHDGPIIQGPFVGEPEKSIFVSGAHYTPYGNKIIARHIFEKIKHRVN